MNHVRTDPANTGVNLKSVASSVLELLAFNAPTNWPVRCAHTHKQTGMRIGSRAAKL